MVKRLSILAIVLLLTATVAATASTPSPVQWDEKASAELTAALHHMHEVWNTGDIAALKELMVGDDVLVSFELDPSTHAPIRLTSKEAIDAFVDKVVLEIDEQEATTKLEMPRLNCRATGNFGVCTEECTVHFVDADGKRYRTDKLWSTAVAVKYEDGWRWIQWHMSQAQVPEHRGAESASQVADGDGR